MLSVTRIKDGKLLTNQKEILDEVKNFYANLYADKQNESFFGQISTTLNKTTKQDEMLWKISQTVSRENRQYCEELFKTKEIR